MNAVTPLKYEPKPGEMRLKAWAIDEAVRQGTTLSNIYHRMERGKYPGLKMRRVNKRVVFVKPEPVNGVEKNLTKGTK